MRKVGELIRDFVGNEAHAYLLLMLGTLYGGIAVALAYQQVHFKINPNISVLKEVGATLIWWGGIVATGSTAKKMTSMIKGDSAGPQPAPAAAPVAPAGN